MWFWELILRKCIILFFFSLSLLVRGAGLSRGLTKVSEDEGE